MNASSLTEATSTWQQLVQAESAYFKARHGFLQDVTDRVPIFRKALRGSDRDTALRLLDQLSEEERKELFPEWIHLARAAHSPFQHAWKVLLELPRAWVLARIEPAVDAILVNEEEDDYWMFLQLFCKLDRELAARLAQRAAAHAAPEIRELGEDYLAKIAANQSNGAAC
jgi:hypothetical protein